MKNATVAFPVPKSNYERPLSFQGGKKRRLFFINVFIGRDFWKLYNFCIISYFPMTNISFLYFNWFSIRFSIFWDQYFLHESLFKLWKIFVAIFDFHIKASFRYQKDLDLIELSKGYPRVKVINAFEKPPPKAFC